MAEGLGYLLRGSDNVKLELSYFTDDSTAMISSNVGFWKKSFGQPKSSVERKVATSNSYLYIAAYPSPSNGTMIHCTVYGLYSVKDRGSIMLKMYDILGREIMNLSDITQKNNDGDRSSFDIVNSSLPSGIYTMILTTGSGCTTRNMIVVK